MKCKTIASNDNQRLDDTINEFIKNKKVTHISSMIFVNGYFLINLFYYDLDIVVETGVNIKEGL